ncbi:MAG: DMT family transporter [Fimbriimonadaceae bacterium]|nr:DMT family transporter [Fimbriimonadaceae bacterium]
MSDRAALMNRPLDRTGIAVALLIYALWGGNNLAIKVSVEAVPPLAAACGRFLLALLVVAPTAWLQGVSLRPQPGELWKLTKLSSLFLLQIAALNIGQQHTSAVRGTVFLAAHPLFVALFAALHIAGDPLRGRRLLGLLTAFAGILLTFSEGFWHSSGTLLGDAIVLASAILLGERLVVLKLVVQDVPPARTLAWQFLLALPIFAVASAALESGAWQPLAARHWAGMLYQGLVIAGFCFVANAWLFQRFRASQVAAYVFTTPLWGVLLCHLLLGDPLTWPILGGVGLVALGIALASRAG